MKILSCVYYLILALLIGQVVSADDCACPNVSCDSQCEVEDGLEFYSRKCDQGLVKCIKPICKSSRDICIKDIVQGGQTERLPASFALIQNSEENLLGEKVAVVKDVIGEVSRASKRNSKGKDLRIGDYIYESDTLTSESYSKVKLEFKDNSKLFLAPKSKIKMSRFQFLPHLRKRSLKLWLSYGRVRVDRSDLHPIEGVTVYTRSSHSLVKGDVVVGFRGSPKQTTDIFVLSGEAYLKGQNRDSYSRLVKHQTQTFKFGLDETDWKIMKEFIVGGYLSPKEQLSSAEVRQLNIDTKLRLNLQVSKENICAFPKGKLNQCYWHCRNNPRGQSRCRVDLPKVQCLRKRCNANGQWSQLTRLPASQSHSCGPGGKAIVKECDY